MFEIEKYGDQILHFLFDDQNDLVLTFFRVQEYYESPKDGLFRKSFSVFDFIKESLDSEGNLDYFSKWSGFNVPSEIFNEWFHQIDEFTPYERKMINAMVLNLDLKLPYYVIGTLKDDVSTIDHEIAHALWTTNPEYRKEAIGILDYFYLHHRDAFMFMSEHLAKMGYNHEVIPDEIHAYIATDPLCDLELDFNLDLEKHKVVIDNFRNLLRKYNKFD